MCQNRKKRLLRLRERFLDLNIHAIIIPSADPHQSEYLSDHWKLRERFSGFTGSAGTLVVTRETAGLWTDSRYFLQAGEELSGSDILLYRQGEEKTLAIEDYLIDNLSKDQSIAINPRLWSYQALKTFREKIKDAGLNIIDTLALDEEIDQLCGRPALPEEPIFIHPSKYCDRTTSEKLELIRSDMNTHDVAFHLITTLDDIAWIFNLRGRDIAYNPVFHAYAIIGKDDAYLFISSDKLPEDVNAHIKNSRITIKEYDEIDSFLVKLAAPILINPDDCNSYLFSKVDSNHIVKGPTISRIIKAKKTKNEIGHIKEVMIKDGVALAKAFYYLFQQLGQITEAEFAAKIAQYRSEQPGYYGESFPAIVGYQANGAIVHYRPTDPSSSLIEAKGLLLCDSGGQYMDGTTDITRTIAVGPVTDAQKENYSRVLKGHIAIDQTKFPEGTTGGALDILARQYLWQTGKNYGHGTGHGVGYFLNVHEPPQGISPYAGTRSTTSLEPGMLTSNEPGYYEEGAYGIRIENLIICEESPYEGFLQHRHVTLFPIDTTIIQSSLMTRDEISWINDYHELVKAKLLPHLEGEVAEWLKQCCIPI